MTKPDINGKRAQKSYKDMTFNKLLNNYWFTQEIKDIRQFLELNGNANRTYTYPWDTLKTGLREKLIAEHAHIRKTD